MPHQARTAAMVRTRNRFIRRCLSRHDFMYEGNQITCGDKSEAVTGSCNSTSVVSAHTTSSKNTCCLRPSSRQITPDASTEVESSTMLLNTLTACSSANHRRTNYGREQMIEQNEPFVYDKSFMEACRSYSSINGFKLRVITKSPVTLSGCQIRLEQHMADPSLIACRFRLHALMCIYSPSQHIQSVYLLYVINQGTDVGSIAEKANQAGVWCL